EALDRPAVPRPEVAVVAAQHALAGLGPRSAGPGLLLRRGAPAVVDKGALATGLLLATLGGRPPLGRGRADGPVVDLGLGLGHGSGLLAEQHPHTVCRPLASPRTAGAA